MDNHQVATSKKRNVIFLLAMLLGGVVLVCLCIGIGAIFFINPEQSDPEVVFNGNGSSNLALPTPTPTCGVVSGERSSDQLESTIDDLSEEINRNPNNAATYNMRGLAYGKMGEYQNAIADFSKAIQLDPSKNIAYSNRGKAHIELGEFAKAIADYSEAIRLNPVCDYLYFDRGWVYLELGNYLAAIDDYNEVIRLDPTNSMAYNNRGYAYDNLGRYQKALDDYRKALSFDPGNSIARDNVAYMESFLNGSDNVVVPPPYNDFDDNLPAVCPHGYAPTGSGGNCELDRTLIDP